MMASKNVSSKVKKTQGKNSGVVFWHTADGDRRVDEIAAIFRKYGEEEPEQIGVRGVFTKVEKAFSRRSESSVFVRRVPAKKGDNGRTEMLDVLEVLPSFVSGQDREYHVVGQVFMTRDAAGYVVGYQCSCGQTVMIRDDQREAFSQCGCAVVKHAEAIANEWFRWRGADAVFDGGNRGWHYIRLYMKHGAIALSDSGRPYYAPTDAFPVWDIVRECGDRLYILPLTEDAAKDVHDLSLAAFMNELTAIEDEVAGWEKNVRASTKERRIESLLDIQKRIGLYDVILGVAKDDLLRLAGDIESSILTALGVGDADATCDDLDGTVGDGGGEEE